MIRPLDGVTVIDLSRAVSGPYCTALLADLGADVIKVEPINGGDTARQWPPFEIDHSLYFDSVNRNKRSVCVDFYAAEGRRVLDRLIARADVLVENFRFGTLDTLGLTGARLEELNPDLVVASVNGFGNTGPLLTDAGLDQVIQGMSGLMSVTGPDQDHASRIGVPIADIASGMVSALGIVAALFGNSKGQAVNRVSTSLLESALNLSVFQGQQALSLGKAPRAQGNHHPTITPYGMFATATDPINIAVGSDKQWRAMCEVIGIPAAAEDPRFSTGAKRTAHRVEVIEQVAAALRERPAAEWMPILSRAGIPCGPINDYSQAFASEQVAALGLVQQSRRRDGSALPLVRGPLSLNGQASEIASPPPSLGEHTAEVLLEFGFEDSEIRELEAEGHITIAAPRGDAAGG